MPRIIDVHFWHLKIDIYMYNSKFFLFNFVTSNWYNCFVYVDISYFIYNLLSRFFINLILSFHSAEICFLKIILKIFLVCKIKNIFDSWIVTLDFKHLSYYAFEAHRAPFPTFLTFNCCSESGHFKSFLNFSGFLFLIWRMFFQLLWVMWDPTQNLCLIRAVVYLIQTDHSVDLDY